MNAAKIAGAVAAVSGAALLILGVIGGASAATGSFAGLSSGPSAAYPMGAMGSNGMGMMGSGHMYGWTGTSAGASGAIAGAPEVRVTAGEFTLSPTEIVLPATGAANLTLVNTGALVHDLTIPGLGVRIVAAAGQTQTAGLRSLPAGTYAAYCSVPGHAEAGMRATVIVR
ncbi:MAG TPA: cupredoxin domain-containing protein [Candidatus Limnocylindria bacterium]|nr:cupredoxin domain-containing protein [Candidatus Limnocylindria bacterium]